MADTGKSSAQTHDLLIRIANVEDVETLNRLINAAFVVERPFIEGDRINPEGVRANMEKGKFLFVEDAAGVAGCIFCELRGERGYVGLLSVDPPRQGTGLGRKLMAAAENYFRAAGSRAIDLGIVSARTPLLEFYRHLGYEQTGTAPFPPKAQAKMPCHFIIMSKPLD
jgi:GNAT superfamily N-acetyltransferase